LQSFFRRLSVFRGSWTVEAAEAVCEEPEALESLAFLEERSLILAEPREDNTGYRMLETIREYGYECLRKHSEDAYVRALHASYFLRLAETNRLVGKMPEVIPAEKAALRILEDHYQNIRSAWQRYSAASGFLRDAFEKERNGWMLFCL
jgi:predicted ATPase